MNQILTRRMARISTRAAIATLAFAATASASWAADGTPAAAAAKPFPAAVFDTLKPSADPVLLARPGAYAESYGQRAQ